MPQMEEISQTVIVLIKKIKLFVMNVMIIMIGIAQKKNAYIYAMETPNNIVMNAMRIIIHMIMVKLVKKLIQNIHRQVKKKMVLNT